MAVRQAVFLVGGKGTRLGALTATTPKPLLPIAPDMLVLDLLIENAARHGFTDIVLLAGHLGDRVELLYHGRRIRGATIRVVREPEPAGTGGALRHAAELLDPWFLLANGDSWFDINLCAFAVAPPRNGLARIALRRIDDCARYGSVELHGKRITAFVEKKATAAGPGLINGGIYLLNRAVLDHVPGPCSIERDVFPALVRRGGVEGQVFDNYFLDIGLPETLAQGRREFPALLARPAAFLDRDGVLNIDRGYTYRPEQLYWTEDAREAVLALNEAGYLVFVVTNQAGVAHGFYHEADVHAFHARMQAELADIGAHVDAFYHCPFHPDATVRRYRHPSHPDRKPNPGMLLKARREWRVSDRGSFLIGDRESDIEAAIRAGIPGLRYEGGSLLATVRQALAAVRPAPSVPPPAPILLDTPAMQAG
ncbi:HAD-IIIA family hydrolase [Aquamicrobium terrae]|uniref:D,D-heptose 1,7-bisphosphate phosphatase n=1 Tax=Aquamicrobium terrae TaxID=1324945 RepID=A0ABV2MZJ4_9HYPH